MLNGIRIDLIAYTASFRVPCFVGHQITLPVPPLSMIYGMISAAMGRIIHPNEVEWLAFRCQHEGVASDLEAIVTFDRGQARSIAVPKGRNVIQREFLLLPHLTLYLPSEWRRAFERPRYALLLGRTQDLATVDRISGGASASRDRVPPGRRSVYDIQPPDQLHRGPEPTAAGS